MNDMKSLEELAPVADEMLAGLHADERMKRRVMAAAKPQARKAKPMRVWVPAVCCAALVLVSAGALRTRLGQEAEGPFGTSISAIAAGGMEGMGRGRMMADLGGAQLRAASGSSNSLFADAQGDIPMVTVGGGVYRMLKQPASVSSALLSGAVGSVNTVTEEPSLAAKDVFEAGLSNVADEGGAVYAVYGLDATTAVAANVGGTMRLFQRVSYAGKGPGGLGLADVFSVRGQVKSLELSGVGELTGEEANRAVDVLLDQAVLKSADASFRAKQTLTVTLTNGLKLQMIVSDDTLSSCGSWVCPEFIELFGTAQ